MEASSCSIDNHCSRFAVDLDYPNDNDGGGGGELGSQSLRLQHSDQRFYSMNALEILRETVRILRFNSTGFLAIAAALICPVSAFALSNALVDPSIVRRLTIRLLLVAKSSGLAVNYSLRQSCQRLSEMVASTLLCFPLSATVLLLAKVAIVYSVACTYAGKNVVVPKFFVFVAKIWRRVVSTYLWACMATIGCLSLFFVILVSVCNIFTVLGFLPEMVVYPALVVVFIFAVFFAHTIIICNLATVISVLEDVSGPQALLRSVFLIRGQTHVGLLIFLGSTIGTTFVEGLFEHRVKTLSYGDGSSRIWEGPLLVIMYSFLVLIDSMMSAVFYFTCRSSSATVSLDGDGQVLVDSNAIASGPVTS